MNKVHISEQKNSIGPFDVNKSISRTRRLTMEVNHPSRPSPPPLSLSYISGGSLTLSFVFSPSNFAGRNLM